MAKIQEKKQLKAPVLKAGKEASRLIVQILVSPQLVIKFEL